MTRELVGEGPFTVTTALEHGLTRGQLRTLVRNHEVRAVLRGVYVAAGVPDSLELRAAAAALVLPAHAVACDRTAAWLHGIDALAYAEHDLIPDLDVVSVGGKNASRRRGVFGGKRDLSGAEIMVVHGVRVTTPIRTACDLACLHGRWTALATLDAFRRRFGITTMDLIAMFPRFAGRRGCKQLRELVPLATEHADSPPESWTRLIIHDAGLPDPEPQVWVVCSDGRERRLENAYESLRIAIEHDGAEHHTRAEDLATDDDRREVLTDDGWIILVTRKGDFTAERRAAWLAELADAIDRRGPGRPKKRRYSRGPDHPSYQWKRRR